MVERLTCPSKTFRAAVKFMEEKYNGMGLERLPGV